MNPATRADGKKRKGRSEAARNEETEEKEKGKVSK
jgi:hypothetical protein